MKHTVEKIEITPESLAQMRHYYQPVGSGSIRLMRRIVALVEAIADMKDWDLDKVKWVKNDREIWEGLNFVEYVCADGENNPIKVGMQVAYVPNRDEHIQRFLVTKIDYNKGKITLSPRSVGGFAISTIFPETAKMMIVGGVDAN